MKVTMVELRRLVVESLRMSLNEAKKKRGKKGDVVQHDIPNRTEDADAAVRSNATKGTGYSHMKDGDFSQPLGDKNLLKRQGAANFGNFTAEQQLRGLVDRIVAEEINVIRRGR